MIDLTMMEQPNSVHRRTLVRDLEHDDALTLVTDESEVQHVLDSVAYGGPRDYGSLLVEVIDGDYGRVYGLLRLVPRLDDDAYRLH